MNRPANIYSKEGIKSRMLRNAASLWGVKNPQALDPFVKLLIDAFSSEIFSVNNEVNNIKTRIVEKLARMLTPTLYTTPRPAHAIAHARPVGAASVLHHNSEFFYKKQIISTSKDTPDSQVLLAFTPAGSVQLIQAAVCGIATGSQLFGFDEQLNKLPLCRVADRPLSHGELWIAIDMPDAELDKIGELPVYFSCPEYEHIDWIYSLLPYTQVYLGDVQLEVTPGLIYADAEKQEGYEEIFNEYSIQKRIQAHIRNIYKQYFITLSGFPEDLQQCKKTLQEVMPGVFNEAAAREYLPGKYLWLKLVFPPQYTFDILEHFKVTINSFPVYNRKWKQNESKFDIIIDNIPLPVTFGEHFLFVEEVSDSTGRRYSEIPYSNTAELQKGLYATRFGGLERFDERNAIDLINYMLELTRDEVAAFSVLDRDNVVSALREMVLQMKFLERKTRQANGHTRQTPAYIIVEPHHERDYIYASYWVTHCTLANNLRTGSLLNDKKSSQLKDGSILLLSNTSGGEEQQNGTDALQAYRYALTSRDRLVTAEDIKSFCKVELRSIAKSVELKKGTAVSTKPKEGFIRTLDIYITIPDTIYAEFNENYWHKRNKTLLQQIEARSVDGINYRLFFTDESKKK
ncbi:type VI secretion system baseplate subunit TssF [Chitinophagaceae bacterium MMS25-I14]